MLKNKIALLGIGAVVIVAGIVLIAGASKKSTTTQSANGNKQITVGNDICAQFPKEWVALAAGKTIVKATPSHTNGTATYACNYYINETNFVSIDVNDYSVEGQKKGQISFGRTLKTDPRIAMDHFIVFETDGLIDSIYLVLTPNRFVTVDRFYGKVFDNEGVIAFAAKVAQKISGGESQTVNSAPTLPPTATPTVSNNTNAPKPQEKDVVNSFFNLINNHRPEDAVSMLAPDGAGSSSEKQAWAVAFNAFESVSIKSVESSMPEEWSTNEHTYKVVLDVKMKPESANSQPMPYYGWGNGELYRWITLEKVGDLWKVKGISTGP